MNVLEIVKDHCVKNGFDGLCNCDAGCACSVENIAPCGEMGETCEPGYQIPCTCGDGCDWDITPSLDFALKVRAEKAEEIGFKEGD